MKKIHRVLALLMAVVMALGLITTAFAEPTIDPSKKASLSIYKYDITKAGNDGAWDAESYVSTGLHDDAVIDKLSKYAIQGVEFTYLRVADIAMNNELVDGQRHVGVLYGFDNSDRSTAVLSAIGLTNADAHKTEGGVNVRNVKFRLHNDTDDCYIIAEQKDGVYYAKGFAAKKADATTFIPNAQGHIVAKGLEDDAYSLTEIATDKGYVLLKDAVKIVIKTTENGQCEKCGAKLLTASATVNGKDVTMSEGNAVVPLTVVNNPGFDLPKTGGYGTWMFTIGGVVLLGAAAFIVIRSRKHNGER